MVYLFNIIATGLLFNYYLHNKEKHPVKKQKHLKKNQITRKARFSKEFKITKDTPEPLNPDDINISINTNQDKKEAKPNYTMLSILWAHFQAYHENLLTEEKDAPWEKIPNLKQQQSKTRNKWFEFLKEIIDEDLPYWINNPDQVKKQTLEVLKNL